ncbi:MAG TPA: Do family serine endopeptidase [Longimicrobiaceae bacterium]|nr:Do family serine endopeptidase [Longimicrobiaceae bacterium]
MPESVRSRAKLVALLLVAFAGGILIASGLDWTQGSQAATLLQTTQPPSRSEVQPLADLSQAFISIAESVTPTVVAITSVGRPQAGRGGRQLPEEFREMFPFQLPEGQLPQQGGSGSGFIISPDGYILTNNHVVEGAERLTVVLKDRRQFDARVIGTDPTTDVAVIKIEGATFPAARLGDAEQTRVGEWVLAIGNPLGDLEFTVTAGIISAKGRPLGIIGESLTQRGQQNLAIEDFIQTDAAINRGNSGGPLVNLRGEVIGINSAIASTTGFYTGYGFAIPIDLARRVADDLIRFGRSRRPILGVSINDVTPVDAEYYRLPSVGGALVQSFSDNSPARRAGLQPGDVIVGVEGERVETVNELQRKIRERRPGETVRVDVMRAGRRREFRIELTEAPAPQVAAAEAPEAQRPAAEERLGLSVEPLTAQLAQQIGYRAAGGVVINRVQPYSSAAERVSRGWKVLRADGEEIRDVEQFRRVVQRKRQGEIISLILGNPDGQESIVNLRVGG